MRIIHLLVLISLFFISCQEEGQEIKQKFTKDQVRRLIASSESKFWELKLTNGDFDPCVNNEVFIFAKNASDTGFLYVTEPYLDCESNLNFERDTISTHRWTLTDSESEIFDNQLFIFFEDDISTRYRVDKINPRSLEMTNTMENANEFLIFEAFEEEGKPPTKDEIRNFLASTGSKFWQLESENVTDFEPCTDGNIYIFSRDETDTGLVYITEPILDCNGQFVTDRDTLETFKWTLTDSESTLFDNQLFLFNDGTAITYLVNEIDDDLLELENASPNSTQVLNLEVLGN